MMYWCLALSLLLANRAVPLEPGDHWRSLNLNQQKRSYLVHVPPGYDPQKPTPVVLVFHGAGMNANIMAGFCDLNRVADREGFITVYPNGTGIRDLFLTWNAGGRNGWGGFNKTEDVAFIAKLLDDLPWIVHVDTRRVYATGMSNGAMMCYRLASELSDRIAAIAPVAGTLAIDKLCCRRPVSVMHFHGTKDKLVPFEGATGQAHRKFRFQSVPETIRQCVQVNGCNKDGEEELLPDRFADGMRVKKVVHNHGKQGAEVILFIVEGGGHSWPGEPAPAIIGPSTRDISANELIWEFFRRHKLE